ncbi:MAG: alpha/beta fold hydrolase [Candidatus Thorarchaeota archaeon]|jgi:pimeloyl-ACP methyl ester carboxylesterase
MLFEISLIFVFMILVWIIVTFRRWKRSLSATLERNSEIAKTSAGEIEYALKGSGPIILFLHGGPGGYDQGLLDLEMWNDAGFSVLSISRPGYLRTPLTTGETYEEQADAIEALLVSLEISEIAVLGASAGGPVALQLALRHPKRVKALILMAAVSHEYVIPEGASDSIMGKIFLSDTGADIGVWIFDILSRRWPSMTMKMSFKQTVGLDSNELNEYVKQVMSIPEQVLWFKRFVRTTCPMSLRVDGLNNDLEKLQSLTAENLNEITCPTMVIHGTVDTDVSYSNAEFSANSIPNARLYSIENVGHVVWLGKHVSKMNSDILEFLREPM